MRKFIKGRVPKGFVARNTAIDIVDGAVILSYDLEPAFKRGDILADSDSIFVFSGKYDGNNNPIAQIAVVDKNTCLSTLGNAWTDEPFREATDEEKKEILDRLKELGYELIDGEIVESTWKPNLNDIVYIVKSDHGIFEPQGVSYSADTDDVISFKTYDACSECCEKLNNAVNNSKKF